MLESSPILSPGSGLDGGCCLKYFSKSFVLTTIDILFQVHVIMWTQTVTLKPKKCSFIKTRKYRTGIILLLLYSFKMIIFSQVFAYENRLQHEQPCMCEWNLMSSPTLLVVIKNMLYNTYKYTTSPNNSRSRVTRADHT